jgi:hypothetical protein
LSENCPFCQFAGQKFWRENIFKIATLLPGITKHALKADHSKSGIGAITDSAYREYEENLKEIRASAGTRRGLARKQSPLERGWTGSTPQGRKFGQPQSPNAEMTFDNFDSILIEYR